MSGDHFFSGLIVPQERATKGARASRNPRERAAQIFNATADDATFGHVQNLLGNRAVAIEGRSAAFQDLSNGRVGGLIKPLPQLDATMVWAKDTTDFAEMQHRLGDDFQIVQDFQLTMPSRGVRADETETRKFRTRTFKPDPNIQKVSGVTEARRHGVSGDNVYVGILDTGIDADHAQFKRRLIRFRHVGFFPENGYSPSRDVRGYDTDGHGTHVAGILGGTTSGIAPGVDLHCASVIESETMRTSMVRIAYGLNWMLRLFTDEAHGLKRSVLNLSLGFPGTVAVDQTGHNMRLNLIHRFIQTLVDADILVVSAIGNDGPGKFSYPAAFPEVLAVGAVDADGKVAPFSGSMADGKVLSKPDLVGFGVDVLSSIERDHENRSSYTKLSGTSMAAPYVSGIAALYRSHNPNLTVADTIDLLKTTAVSVAGKGTGAGLAAFQWP